MQEFFVVTQSKAAPFLSDEGTGFVRARNFEEAVEVARRDYDHPAGLFALAVYGSATAYHKGEKPLAQWLSKRADMRANGVKCSHCGGKTRITGGNHGPSGTTDVHTCNDCKKDTAVDMSKI